MISVIKSLIEDFIMIPSFNVIILGPQESGKTRLFNLIKNHDNLSQYLMSCNGSYTATVGLNSNFFDKEATNYKRTQARVCVWDLGGKKTIRKIWQNYFPESHGIIYLVDSKHEMAFQQSMFTLKELLRHNEMARIPIMILTNSVQTIDAVRKFIENQPQLFFREYDLRLFQFEQVGMLSSPKNAILKQQNSIQQMMTWLYKRIATLKKQVDEYEINQ